MPKFLLLTCLLLSACWPANDAQTQEQLQVQSAGPGPIASPEISAQASAVALGGQMKQAIDGNYAKAMLLNAQNLLNQKYPAAGISLLKVISYTTQVVAGSNHRLEVEFKDLKGHKGLLKVTVYQDINGNNSLTQDNYKPTGK